MKLHSLRLVNYRRHQDTRIEFADGVTAIVGRNGSGKSTILEALGFALFGAGATRTGKELLRFDGAAPSDAVTVDLEMELGGQAVAITRSLRGKNLTPSAELTIDGTVLVPRGAGSNDAATQEVQRLLGMDRDAFFTTVVARQKELSRLADMGPEARKRMLLAMLGVDALDRAIQGARGKARSARERVETLREVLPDRKALRQESKAATGRATDAAAGRDKALAALTDAELHLEQATSRWEGSEETRIAHQQAATAHANAEQQVAHAQETVVRLKDELAAAAAAHAEAEGLASAAAGLIPLQDAWDRWQAAERHRKAASEARAALAGLPAIDDPTPLILATQAEVLALDAMLRQQEAAIAVARSEQGSLRNRLRRIGNLGEDAPCPVCEQPVGGHLPALRGRLADQEHDHGETLERLQTEHADATNRRQDAVATLGALEEKRQRRHRVDEERARLQATLDASQTAIGHAPADGEHLRAELARARDAHERRIAAIARAGDLPALRRRYSDAQATLAKRRADREAAAAEVLARPWDEAAHARRKQDLAAAQAHRQSMADQVAVATTTMEVARRDAAEAARRLQEADDVAQKLRLAEEEARYWNALAGGRGRGLLEAFRSHLVARIGPAVSGEASRLLARFTQGRYTEVLLDAEYRLYVADGGVHYSLDRFSGGEVDLVHLALRLAVSRLVAESSGGAELRLLALDEVFGSLDADRRASVLAALGELGALYSQVLLVTHQESLQDSLDGTLVVADQGGVASVLVHKG